MVKSVKRNAVEFKSKGNGKQFDHQQQVLDCLTDAQHSLANSNYEKAKRAIEEGLPQRVGFFCGTRQQDRTLL